MQFFSLFYRNLTASESLEWLYDFFWGEWWPSFFPLVSVSGKTSHATLGQRENSKEIAKTAEFPFN